MTNSTAPKKPKVKGPLRLEAIIPVTIIVALLMVYFSYFFDLHVRKSLEWVGTKANGAEVNIGLLKTSFLKGSLRIEKIEVTDKSQPKLNLIEIGSMHFQLLWDALLRAKFVVDDASILQIQFKSPRKTPGYVIPPTPPDGKPSLLEKSQDAVLAQAKKQYNGNMLGDIASMLGGTDPKDQLKLLEDQLKSSGYLKDLEKMVNEKKAAWEQRIKELPDQKQINDLQARVKALKFDAKNPAEFAKSVSEADKIVKEVNQKVKTVEEANKALKTDMSSVDQSYKQLETYIQQDMNDLQARLKIPSLDPKELSKTLFTRMFEEKLVQVRKYTELAREYMPPKKAPGEKSEELIPPKRGAGKNYKFPITTSYPLFWLKHAAISSQSKQGDWAGELKGELKDVTSDPVALQKPIIATLDGQFPNQKIYGLQAKAVLDHTTEVAKETLTAKVGSFPLSPLQLSDSNDVKLSLDKATGQSNFQAVLQNMRLEVGMDSVFKDNQFNVQAKNSTVQEMLTGVVTSLPALTLNANAVGSWDDFSLNINSNLGQELNKAFQKQIQMQIDKARAQLKALVDDKIKVQKAQIDAEINKLKSQLTGSMDKKQAELNQAKNSLEKDAKGQQSSSNDKLKKEGEKALQDLKKKFGF